MTKPKKLKHIHGPRAALGEAVIEDLADAFRDHMLKGGAEINENIRVKHSRGDDGKLLYNASISFIDMDTDKVTEELKDAILLEKAVKRIVEKTGTAPYSNDTEEVLSLKKQFRGYQAPEGKPGVGALERDLIRSDEQGNHYLDEKALDRLIRHINKQPNIPSAHDSRHDLEGWKISNNRQLKKQTQSL